MEQNSKPKKLERLKQWLSLHRKIVLISAGILILLIGGLVSYLILAQPEPIVEDQVVATVVKKTDPKPEPVKYYSPLTGNLVADEATTKLAVTGVMIENSPEARPQSGLKDAGVVFEAIAEAGITRFLTLFQSEKPQLVGPVRSVRIYYVDWLSAFDASIAHAGGSAEALAEVRNGNYRDIDQFFNGDSYWRSSDRYAPHNLYTSFNNLDALNASKGYTSSTFTGFTRVDGKASAAPDATSINVTISGELFNSSYAYDGTTNTYARSQAGAPHLDTAGQITPSVVIAMHVDESTLSDGHESITTVGSGSATIFQNGTAINAVWTKSSRTDQIKFTDAVGADIPLVRGQTWIVAVPNDGGDVSWT
jgi:hypothetical protein